MTVELLPVVEFEPGSYATTDREFPTETSFHAPDLWSSYWKASLSDSGIENLTPLEPGSWLVPVERLRDDLTLDALLDVALRDIEDVEAGLPGPLDGGFVLTTGPARLRPQCCGDLSNLEEEWSIAADLASPDWQPVWIGHPSTHVRKEGGRLWVTEPRDDAPPEGEAPLCAIESDALRTAIAEAQEALDSFAERLLPRLELRMSTRAAERVASALMGLGRLWCGPAEPRRRPKIRTPDCRLPRPAWTRRYQRLGLDVSVRVRWAVLESASSHRPATLPG